MLGGNDMNVFGSATQGKNTEKKTVSETFLTGHGWPFVPRQRRTGHRRTKQRVKPSSPCYFAGFLCCIRLQFGTTSRKP